MTAGDVEVNITSPSARYGAKFDGTDDSVEKDENLISDFPFTMSAWVYGSDGAIFFLVDKDVADKMFGYYINGAGPTLNIFARNTSTDIYTGPAISTTQWNHVLVVFRSATDREIYLNGTSGGQDTSSVSFSANTDRWSIGRIGDSTPSTYFTGVISDVKLYSVDLTTSEITNLANNIDVTRGLQNHWKLKDDYNDFVGSSDGTNDGTYLGIFDSSITNAIEADRTTANDIYLIADSAKGKQAISTIIEEAP